MTTSKSTDEQRESQRRIEGSIEWRGRRSYRVRVANGIDPVTGTRRWLYATGQGNVKAAEKALRDLLVKRDTGLEVQPKRVTVASWLQTWLDGRIADDALGPRTAENYRTILRRRLVPELGHLRLQDLRTDHVLALKTAMLEEGRAPATVKKALGLLRQSLAAAVAAGLVPRNVADAVPSPSVTRSFGERRALSEREIEKLLGSATGTEFDTPIRFALVTALRQAEQLGLSWADVDLERQTLRVRRTLTYVDKEFRVLQPKTRNSRRTIELSTATVELLRRHRRAQREERLRVGPAWCGEQWGDLVFADPLGRPQHRQAFLRRFQKVVSSAEIANPETLNWHSLRHTAASLWIRAGVDAFTVSRRLGHSSAAFTMDVYGHLMEGQQQQAAEALDHLIAR